MWGIKNIIKRAIKVIFYKNGNFRNNQITVTKQKQRSKQTKKPFVSIYICIFVMHGLFVLVTQSCPTLCDPMDWSPPDSSVHGILLARILEWAAIPFSRGSSWPRDWTQVSCTAGRFFTSWAIRKPMDYLGGPKIFQSCKLMQDWE